MARAVRVEISLLSPIETRIDDRECPLTFSDDEEAVQLAVASGRIMVRTRSMITPRRSLWRKSADRLAWRRRSRTKATIDLCGGRHRPGRNS